MHVPLRGAVTALLTLLLLASALPVAAADDDGGSGGDAPNSRGSAMPVGLGTLHGSASVAYDEDWYRVGVSPGKALGVYLASSTGSGYVYLHEEEGTYLTYERAGRFTMLQPSAGVVFLKVTGSYSTMDYTLTLSEVNVPAQDDAGTGRDAGNTHATPTAVAAQVFGGRIDRAAGDYADWYRVEAAADEFIDVRSYGYYGVGLDLRDERGVYLGGGGSVLPPRGVLLVGVYSYSSETYTLEVVRVKRADLSVEGVEVVPVPLQTEEGPTPVSPQRDVHVDLANAGPGASRDARLLVYTLATGAVESRRVLADVPVTLAAGEAQTHVIPWDTLGQAGDVTLHVEVSNLFDMDAEDGRATVRSYNLVGGTVVGVDLLNHRVSRYGVTVGFEYGATRDGPYASVLGVGL